MGGTKIGGQRAAATNKRKYGQDFYAVQGRIGGRNGHTGGFKKGAEATRAAGRKGGRIGRRGPKKLMPDFKVITNLNDSREDFWPEPDEVFDFHIEPKPLKHKFLWWRW